MEYDDDLQHVTRESLSMENIGTVLWGPIAFLLPEAMAYYLPRLIEFAVLGAKNKHGDSFISQFLNQIGLSGGRSEQFVRLDDRHRRVVLECLQFIREHWYDEIENKCCERWLEDSLLAWRRS